MAAREASIKLTLNGGGFVSTMNQVMNETEAKAKRTGSAMKSAFSGTLSGAGSGMKKALGDMGSQVKNALTMGATLGGSIGLGMMVKQAIDLREKLRNVEFAINKAGKETVSWQSLMKDANAAADETGRSSTQMADAMAQIFEATGDADFARKSITTIGHTATATGKDFARLTDIAGMLFEKFGATPDTLPAMLAVVAEKTDAGGLALDAMREKFGLLAGEAIEAGFKGETGLSAVLGMLNALDDRLGEKSLPSFKKLFQVLKDGSSSLKSLSKESGIKFKADTTGLEKIRKLMETPKGRKALEEKLGGEQRVVFDELAKPFDEAFKAAKGNGAKTKEATTAGLAAFDKAMAAMADHSLEAGVVKKKSLERQKDDPMVAVNRAIERVAREFNKPEMIEAVDKLAERLPELAKGVVGAIDFITRRPKTAIALVVGGKLAVGAIEGALGKLGTNVGDSLAKKAPEWGAAFAAKVASDGGWLKLAGQFGLIAGAAFAATEIGKSLIDSSMDKDEKKTRGLADAAATAESMAKHGTGTEEERKAAAAELKQKIAAMEKDEPGLANKLFGSAANFVDPSVEHPMNAWVAQLDSARAALAQLEQSPVKAAQANDKLALSAERATRAIEKMGNAADDQEAPPGVPKGTSKGPGGVGNKGNTAGHAM